MINRYLDSSPSELASEVVPAQRYTRTAIELLASPRVLFAPNHVRYIELTSPIFPPPRERCSRLRSDVAPTPSSPQDTRSSLDSEWSFNIIVRTVVFILNIANKTQNFRFRFRFRAKLTPTTRCPSRERPLRHKRQLRLSRSRESDENALSAC
jgi:hypothetical protein